MAEKKSKAELEQFLDSQHKRYLQTVSRMREKLVTPMMMADDVFERRELEKKSNENPVITNYAWWDDIVGSLRRGNLYVLAGYAGTGKTTLAMQLAWAISQTRKVWFYCLELTPVEVLEVLIGHICGNTEPNEAEYLLAECKAQSSGIRFFDSTKYRSWEEHLQIIEAGVAAEGVEFVIIDNFHFLTRVQKNATDVEGVVSQRLKGLSQSCHIPILLLHHLRKPESDTSEPEPSIHTMRGSSALLNDASGVVLLHHPLVPEGEGFEEGTREAIGKLRAGKSRWGKGGARYVRLVGWKRLYEVATAEEYNQKKKRRSTVMKYGV